MGAWLPVGVLAPTPLPPGAAARGWLLDGAGWGTAKLAVSRADHLGAEDSSCAVFGVDAREDRQSAGAAPDPPLVGRVKEGRVPAVAQHETSSSSQAFPQEPPGLSEQSRRGMLSSFHSSDRPGRQVCLQEENAPKRVGKMALHHRHACRLPDALCDVATGKSRPARKQWRALPKGGARKALSFSGAM